MRYPATMDLLTIEEAAAELDRTPEWLRALCREKDITKKVLHGTKRAGVWFISREEVERFNALGRHPGRPKNSPD